MQDSQKEKCIICSSLELFDKIDSHIGHRFILLHTISPLEIVDQLRINRISCLIIYVGINNTVKISNIHHIANLFPQLPISGIIDPYHPVNLMEYGKAGIKHVISTNDLSKITEILEKITCENFHIHSWTLFGIRITECSLLVQNALQILKEKNRVIQSVQQLSDELRVSPETLAREFKRSCNIGPKKLLITLKLEHAKHLMKNPNLKLKAISKYAGFTDERHFRKNFKQMHYKSPSEFRWQKFNIRDVEIRYLIQ